MLWIQRYKKYSLAPSLFVILVPVAELYYSEQLRQHD